MQTPQTLPSMSNPASCDLGAAGPQTPAEAVFERLSTLLGPDKLGALWANAEPHRVKAEWDAALAGLERSELARGLAGCRRLVFAPTLGEFLRLARPAMDPEFAWFEAGECLRQRDAGQRGDWTHPAVYRAALVMSAEVRAGDLRHHRKRWEFLLDREFRRGWLTGVPEPLKALEHSEGKTRPPTPEERAKISRLIAQARGGMTA